MRNIDFQIAFELGINSIDSLNKPVSRDIEYWLNKGLMKFVKTRYSGLNSHLKGFEQNQKRTDDLRTLVVEQPYYDLPTHDGVTYSIMLPEKYFVTLGETAYILPNTNNLSGTDCWDKDADGNMIAKRSDVLETTIEELDRELSNSLSEHRFHNGKARPARIYLGDSIKLYTDGKYKIKDFTLTYLRHPESIDIHNKPFELYTGMPEHTHDEIVQLAVSMYLENNSNPRYQSHGNEVATIE